MRPELTRLARIEQHLLQPNPPSPAESAAWQTECLLDPELQADAEAQQQLYQGLQLAGRRQLRRELQGIHHRLYGPGAAGWLHAATHGLRSLLRRSFGRVRE
ncbi:hypothetical protein [Hymenobacter sp. CRA2]|uniref:hypothetical protein n=1 Tax=Hymenobacter sp. CRA2 TaxID=1955620 RepID=UPI00098F885F|nr:hypothetical protein [Hymenobacter sp. CRA2]OON66465.1 hypothetical protein B0919_21775 [Hymenobacter sp. CRA2]